MRNLLPLFVAHAPEACPTSVERHSELRHVSAVHAINTQLTEELLWHSVNSTCSACCCVPQEGSRTKHLERRGRPACIFNISGGRGGGSSCHHLQTEGLRRRCHDICRVPLCSPTLRPCLAPNTLTHGHKDIHEHMHGVSSALLLNVRQQGHFVQNSGSLCQDTQSGNGKAQQCFLSRTV